MRPPSAALLVPRSRLPCPTLVTLVCTVFLHVLPPHGAEAQVDVLTPVFSNLSGGAVWGSAGFGRPSGQDDRAMWRAAAVAFYGPFGGKGDTVFTFTRSISDSSDTTLCDPSEIPPRKLHRRTRTTQQQRYEIRQLGAGKVTLVIGYQHSAFYRLGVRPLPPAIPVGGVFVASLFGPVHPYPRWKRLGGYMGIGGTVVQLNDLVGRIDTLAVSLSTERTLAPELLLMFEYQVAPGYRILFGGSYQYLRFGSVDYRASGSGGGIAPDVLARLPDTLELQTVHLSIGVSFVAKGLLSGR